MIDENFIKENYSRMELSDLKKLSNEPQKLNIEAFPILIEELKKRKQLDIVNQLNAFYESLTIQENQNKEKLKLEISENKMPPKLNGWFLLLSTGLVIKPILVIIYYFNDFIPVLKEIEAIEKMPRNGLAKLQGIDTIDFNSMRNSLYLISGMNFISGVLCLPLLYLLINYKKSFPRYMIKYIVLIMITTLVSNIVNAQLITLNLIVTILIGLIWIYYLSHSKSTNKTFIK